MEDSRPLMSLVRWTETRMLASVGQTPTLYIATLFPIGVSATGATRQAAIDAVWLKLKEMQPRTD